MSMFNDRQQDRRLDCLKVAADLVSLPMHAAAANPQNITALANIFYAYVEGVETPVVKPVEAAPPPAEDGQVKYA